MALMTNGKKVDALALGGTEFYSMNKNADGSLSFNGEVYSFGNKTSNSFVCTWWNGSVGVGLRNGLSSGSVPTVKDLINKRKKIRLTIKFHNYPGAFDVSLVSDIIDLSKPDSNGHFNFQWIHGATSANTYCYSDSSANMFKIYSDVLETYTSSNYDEGHITINYSDES